MHTCRMYINKFAQPLVISGYNIAQPSTTGQSADDRCSEHCQENTWVTGPQCRNDYCPLRLNTMEPRKQTKYNKRTWAGTTTTHVVLDIYTIFKQDVISMIHDAVLWQVRELQNSCPSFNQPLTEIVLYTCSRPPFLTHTCTCTYTAFILYIAH